MPDPSAEEERGSEELLTMMGHVMTSWQAVEHGVFDIYQSFFANDHFDVAALVFFSVRTFEARTRLADALVSDYCRSTDAERWAKLQDKIRKAAKVRNEVAHGLFVLFGNFPSRKAMISPSVYDVGRFSDGKPRDNDFLSINALKTAANSYASLGQKLRDFSAEARGDQELQTRLRARPQRAEMNDQRTLLRVRKSLEP